MKTKIFLCLAVSTFFAYTQEKIHSREDFVRLWAITGTYFLYLSKDTDPLIISETHFEDYLLGEEVPVTTPRVFFYFTIEDMEKSVHHIQSRDVPFGGRLEDMPKMLENLERKEQERKKYYTSLDEVKSLINGENISKDVQQRAQEVLNRFFNGDRALKNLSFSGYVLDWKHGFVVHLFERSRINYRDEQGDIFLQHIKRRY